MIYGIIVLLNCTWGISIYKSYLFPALIHITIVATIITFLCWGVWHFLFFYVDGSIEAVNVPYFLLGLLTNCFIFQKEKERRIDN